MTKITKINHQYLKEINEKTDKKNFTLKKDIILKVNKFKNFFEAAQLENEIPEMVDLKLFEGLGFFSHFFNKVSKKFYGEESNEFQALRLIYNHLKKDLKDKTPESAISLLYHLAELSNDSSCFLKSVALSEVKYSDNQFEYFLLIDGKPCFIQNINKGFIYSKKSILDKSNLNCKFFQKNEFFNIKLIVDNFDDFNKLLYQESPIKMNNLNENLNENFNSKDEDDLNPASLVEDDLNSASEVEIVSTKTIDLQESTGSTDISLIEYPELDGSSYSDSIVQTETNEIISIEENSPVNFLQTGASSETPLSDILNKNHVENTTDVKTLLKDEHQIKEIKSIKANFPKEVSDVSLISKEIINKSMSKMKLLISKDLSNLGLPVLQEEMIKLSLLNIFIEKFNSKLPSFLTNDFARVEYPEFNFDHRCVLKIEYYKIIEEFSGIKSNHKDVLEIEFSLEFDEKGNVYLIFHPFNGEDLEEMLHLLVDIKASRPKEDTGYFQKNAALTAHNIVYSLAHTRLESGIQNILNVGISAFEEAFSPFLI